MSKLIILRKKTTFFLAALLVLLGAAMLTAEPVKAKADVLPTCYQQGDVRWAYEQFGMANIGASGCGLLSTVNAVNYQTGNFINPVELARWGYQNNYYNGSGGQGTMRWLFFPALNDAFGSRYGFKISGCSGGSITSPALINHLKNGGSAIVHVPNHFMAINAYNAATGQYLVYDSAAAPHRNTSVNGSWLTAEQLNSIKLTVVDWFCLVTKTGGSTSAPSPVTAYELKAEAVGNGKVHFGDNVTSAKLQEGTIVNYQTTPSSGYKVSEILINGETQIVKNGGADAVYQFAMPAKNTVVIAKFDKISAPVYTLTAQTLSGNGKVHFGNGLTETTVAENTFINFEVNPAYGEKVTEVSVNGTPLTIQNDGRDYVYNFTMPAANTIVSAKFETAVYSLTASVTQGNGNVHFGENVTATSAAAGTLVHYQATPSVGYKVSEILINGIPQTVLNEGADAVYNFSMPNVNTTVAVKFEQADVILTLKATVSEGGGTVHFGNGVTETVSKQGNVIYYEACPDYGFKVTEILINGVPQTIVKNGEAHVYSFEMPAADTTVSVKFGEKKFYATATVSGEGTVKFAGSGNSSATVRQGVDVNFTVTPSSGYKVTEILIDKTPLKILNDGGAATYAFNMPGSSVTILVKFELTNPAFTLDGESSDGGNIDFESATKTGGETVLVRVAPNAGYIVYAVKLNGVSIPVLNDGAAATYSFKMPSENAKFTVEFKKIENSGGGNDNDSGKNGDSGGSGELNGSADSGSQNSVNNSADNSVKASQKRRLNVFERVMVFVTSFVGAATIVGGIVAVVKLTRRKKNSGK